ncbi:ABC transporter ATP-binding protein [Desulfoluna spongiiphila]|uniref:NitT/TauT family transport system ATP-binding protein n=1 Tax=Desulfoluna spongiiphila TaxID=419481 RepID=A0A1G5IJR1_9BACT|nr:ABC transporter ATP-binding protein [Desulfoluna spongiiphila]SCY76356.1 NitT/TauT family transport system ATP-binding protein [Desulfoluna spongiiphila]VVS90950.1 abc transporter-like [Desulfoluna spongiiphila]
MTDKIRLSDISKIFKLSGRKRKAALGGVRLSVAEGDFVVVLGRSGCGKSTLLNIVAGMVPPTAGEVTVDGSAVDRPDPSRILLTQQPMLLPWLTVLENVAFGCKLRGETEDLLLRARTWLERVHMTGHESYLPGELSQGMQQRVCLARALMGQPDLLLMDEPFGALDTFTRSRLHEEMMRIRQETDITVVFVTHDLDEALALGSRVVLLGGEPGHIMAEFKLDRSYPRDPADPVLRGVKEEIMELFQEVSL